MNRINISVVVCTRDREEKLRCCLTSIARSTLQPVEVVVVDQSSNSHTMKVVNECSRIMPAPLKYLRLDSVGHTRARNAGVNACSGDIVAFTDDDCIVDEYWLEALSIEFNDAQANCVCGQTRPASHDNRPKPALISTIFCRKRKFLRGKRNPVTIGKGNNMAFRMDDLVCLGGFNENIGVGTRIYAGDDTDLFYRLLMAGGVIVRTPKAVVLHAQPDDWCEVIKKKRGYSISAAAVLASRVRYGDYFAALLLCGKIAYEFSYLFCGGLVRMNLLLASIGWHSFLGSLSGFKYLLNSGFCEHANELSLFAQELFTGTDEAGKLEGSVCVDQAMTK